MQLNDRFYQSSSTSFNNANYGNKQLSQQFCEVQAIVLAHYSTYDIHPLLQSNVGDNNTPKFLLPFCNKPIITYPLHLLEIHGFNEIIIVIIEEYIDILLNFLDNEYTYYNHDNQLQKSHIQIATVSEEDLGEIQVLKEISNYIKTDFLVIRSDIFTNAPLRELLRIHRRLNSSITLLLSKKSKSSKSGSKSSKNKNKNKNKVRNPHIIGTDIEYHRELIMKGHPQEVERLWYMCARADLEDDLDGNMSGNHNNKPKNKHNENQVFLNKNLLDFRAEIKLTTKYKMQQIGIFCRWILLWIIEDAPNDYEYLYEEAVPHLIDMQSDFITGNMNGNGNGNMSGGGNDNNNNNSANSSFKFPDLMRKASSNVTDLDIKKMKKNVVPQIRFKKELISRNNSQFASGIFLSHGSVLGNDYMSSIGNLSNPAAASASQSSLGARSLFKSFDDAKSDITSISMSAVSTYVNPPITPKATINNDNDPTPNPTPNPNKQSPLSQHVSALPSPNKLSRVDPDDGTSNDININLTQQQSNLIQSEYIPNDGGIMNEDKLKVFGYVFEEDNHNYNFSTIINSSDCYEDLSLNLMNSILMFQQKEKQKQIQLKNAQKLLDQRNRIKKQLKYNNKPRNNKNEEKSEYISLRHYEDTGLFRLIMSSNYLEICREENECNNNKLKKKIKNGCIISPNCIIGDKTIIDKSILGSFVKIGTNCKIINCIIFKHVNIGNQCKISNTIISSYTNINDKCILHKCKIADKANIIKESNLKNEIIQTDFINMTDDDDDDDGDDNNNNDNNNNNDKMIDID